VVRPAMIFFCGRVKHAGLQAIAAQEKQQTRNKNQPIYLS
jgi:hypothetical protein